MKQENYQIKDTVKFFKIAIPRSQPEAHISQNMLTFLVPELFPVLAQQTHRSQPSTQGQEGS